MSKASRVSLSIPVPPASSATETPNEGHPLVSIALFCGIGLVVSLLATLMGVQGAWY